MTSKQRNRQSGMTLIELMIAMTMLVVGLIGVLGLITTAITSNNRNKLDTGGTMMAQMVLEKIASQPANLNADIALQDCNPGAPNAWIIRTIDSIPAGGVGSGADLDVATGDIDWGRNYGTQPVNYKMLYVTCGANGQQVTYDVRWHIQNVNTYSKMIVVGARPLGYRTNAGTDVRFYARPVTLRSIVSTF